MLNPNNKVTFEDFMQEMCPDSGTGGADGAQEAYENWSGNLDAEEVWDYAQKWGEYQYINGQKDALNEVKSLAQNIN